MRLRRPKPPPPAAPAPAGPLPILASASDAERAIVAACQPHSITSAERLLSVVDAVRHCVANGVPGAFAECGVWRGGCVLAMILALQDSGVDDRDVWLYDTFEGMTKPIDLDDTRFGPSAEEVFAAAERAGTVAFPEYFTEFDESDVRARLAATGYPQERLHYVRGRVEDTLPAQAPDRLALLRLDTDWYESTRHELEHLYPRISSGGVLIVDDYGHWDGCRRAVDEYFEGFPPRPLLARVDYTAVMGVRP